MRSVLIPLAFVATVAAVPFAFANRGETSPQQFPPSPVPTPTPFPTPTPTPTPTPPPTPTPFPPPMPTPSTVAPARIVPDSTLTMYEPDCGVTD